LRRCGDADALRAPLPAPLLPPRPSALPTDPECASPVLPALPVGWSRPFPACWCCQSGLVVVLRATASA
jgi:hypothetical protein